MRVAFCRVFAGAWRAQFRGRYLWSALCFTCSAMLRGYCEETRGEQGIGQPRIGFPTAERGGEGGGD